MPKQAHFDLLISIAKNRDVAAVAALREKNQPLSIAIGEEHCETPALRLLMQQDFESCDFLFENRMISTEELAFLVKTICIHHLVPILKYFIDQSKIIPNLQNLLTLHLTNQPEQLLEILCDIEGALSYVYLSELVLRKNLPHQQGIKLIALAKQVRELKSKYAFTTQQAQLAIIPENNRLIHALLQQAVEADIDEFTATYRQFQHHIDCQFLISNPTFKESLILKTLKNSHPGFHLPVFELLIAANEVISLRVLETFLKQNRHPILQACLFRDKQIALQLEAKIKRAPNSESKNLINKALDEILEENLKKTKPIVQTEPSVPSRSLTPLPTPSGLRPNLNGATSVDSVVQIARKYHVHTKYLGLPGLPITKVFKNQSSIDPSSTWPKLTIEKIQTKKRSRNPAVVTPILLQRNWFKFNYYTRSDSSPTQNERVSIFFAKRGNNGFYPQESQGGRIILILSPDEEVNAQELLGEHRDVCVILELKMQAKVDQSIFTETIPKDELGLIMSRRVAGLFLAQYCQLNHVMFIDDNIQEYRLNQPNTQALRWEQIYQFFAQQAHSNGFTCVSPRSWRPELLNNLKDEDDIEIDGFNQPSDKLGSKVFFVDMQDLRQVFPDYSALSTLLTNHRTFWGSDLFFQLMILFSGRNGVIDHNQFLIVRAKTDKNSALHTLKKAPIWLEPTKAQDFLPGLQQRVFRTMQQIVQNSLIDYDNAALQYSVLDLKKTHCLKNNKLDLQASTMVDRTLSAHCWTIGMAEVMAVNESNLYDYQKTAVSDMLRNSGKTGIVQAPPRTGKTVMIWDYISRMIARTEQWKGHLIIITPRRDLVQQLYEDCFEFKKFMQQSQLNIYDVIKISSSDETDISQRVLALNTGLKKQPAIFIICESSFMKLHHAYPAFFDLVAVYIADEVHKLSKRTLSFINHCNQSKGATVIAVSATPGERALTLFPNRIFTLPLPEAIQKDIIAQCKIDSLGVPFSPEMLNQFTKLLPTFLNTRYHPAGGLYKNKKMLVFVPTIEMANALYTDLSQQLPCLVLHSKLTQSNGIKKERIPMVFSDRNQSFNVLILVQMCKFGTTFDCDGVIYLQKSARANTANASDDLYQAVARCMQKIKLTSSISHKSVVSILLFDDANATHLQGLTNMDSKQQLLSADYLNQSSTIIPESPFKIKSFEFSKPIISADSSPDLSDDNDSLEEGEVREQKPKIQRNSFFQTAPTPHHIQDIRRDSIQRHL